MAYFLCDLTRKLTHHTDEDLKKDIYREIHLYRSIYLSISICITLHVSRPYFVPDALQNACHAYIVYLSQQSQ